MWIVATGVAAETAFMRRRGYPVGFKTVVRCRDEHLFTTIWIPGVSLKAIRLGAVRLQYCPVGQHFTSVRPVKEVELRTRSEGLPSCITTCRFRRAIT